MWKLLSLEHSVHALVSFVNYVTQTSPTISQTLFQSYSKIFHPLRDICSGIAAISSLVLFFSSAKVLGLEMKTLLFRYPHKKQSQADWSGERAGHGTSPTRQMTCCRNISRRTLTDALAVWVVAPSCWNQTDETSIPRQRNSYSQKVHCFAKKSSDVTLTAATSLSSKK
jgi:hypothetical protein